MAEGPLELYKAVLGDAGEARKSFRAETASAHDAVRKEEAATRDAARERQKGEDGDDLDRRKTTRAAFQEAQKAEQTAALAHFTKFYESVVGLAVGSVDRSRAAADLVQKSSAAVATLYTGILALVFSVTDNPLPARGALTPFFLGLAVVLSTAFIAYLGRPGESTPGPAAAGTVEGKGYAQLNTLIEMTTKLAVRRSGALRASVVALGVGLGFIVMPFISFTAPQAPAALTSPAASPAPSSNPVPSWPAQPTGGSEELNKIRYQAEIDEAVAARQAASKTVAAREYDVEVLLGGLAAGLLVVVGVTFLVRPHARTVRRTGGGVKGWLRRKLESAATTLGGAEEDSVAIPVTVHLTEAQYRVWRGSSTVAPQETIEDLVQSVADAELTRQAEAEARTKQQQGVVHHGAAGDGAAWRAKAKPSALDADRHPPGDDAT